jgi:hypothetical protein
MDSTVRGTSLREQVLCEALLAILPTKLRTEFTGCQDVETQRRFLDRHVTDCFVHHKCVSVFLNDSAAADRAKFESLKGVAHSDDNSMMVKIASDPFV